MQQQELTPKQQSVELIKQAQHILLVTGKEPNNDQLSAMVALDLVLARAGKQVSAIVTGDMPKAKSILDTKGISRDLSGIRDFIIRLDTSNVEVDKLRYETNENNLEVVISPFSGNFSSADVSFDHGQFKFDLVIVLGVGQISRIDKILEGNPTIFDGLHLINIDCHSSNESYGSVNFVDTYASSVCEMLVGILESVAQGMIDYHVATALLTGIMASTKGFTAPNTSAKSLTIAAQMMSAGAKQQDIVNTLFSQGGSYKAEDRSNDLPKVENKLESRISENSSKKANQGQEFSIMNPPKIESNKVESIKDKVESDLKGRPERGVAELKDLKTEPATESKAETIADKLKKQGVELTQEGVKDSATGQVIKDEVLADTKPTPTTESEDTLKPKKFKNPEPTKQ